MNKVLRLENTNFVFGSAEGDYIDKILAFDVLSGDLKVYTTSKPVRIAYSLEQFKVVDLVRSNFGYDGGETGVRIIHNSPIVSAYSAPLKLYVDITSFCSLDCHFCLSNSTEQGIHLPLSIMRRMAIEVKELGISYVKIGGGDPFLHPNFAEVISLFRSAGAFVSISTNSVTVDSESIRILADFGVKVSVSIEGMESTNDSIRGVGHFHKAMRVLDSLRNAGVKVLLRTTLLRQNLKDVPELIDLAKVMGVKIKFSYCRPAGRAVRNNSMLGPQDAKDYLKVLNYLNDPSILPYVVMDEGMMFDQPSNVSSKLLHGRMCGAANRSMHIDVNGKASPCIFLGPDYSFGKIYQDGSIRDFWRGMVGDKFLAVRVIKQPHECDGCDRICKDECPANRLYFSGGFDQQDPNCLREVLRKCGVQ